MGVVRINDELLKKIQDWLNDDENKYKHPSISSFVNSVIYEKLKKLEKEMNK